MTVSTSRLLKTVGSCWLSFLLTGLLIQRLIVPTKQALLIDRSYCSSYQWAKVTRTYDDLYRKHQQSKIKLEPVILFSNLSHEVFNTAPPPKMIESLPTYGQFDAEHQATIQQKYPGARLLSCR